MGRYHIVDFAGIPGVPCPCGTARRAFADVPEFPATVHVTSISIDAQLHYHKRLTETYYVLECGADARMQLDNEIVPVKTLSRQGDKQVARLGLPRIGANAAHAGFGRSPAQLTLRGGNLWSKLMVTRMR